MYTVVNKMAGSSALISQGLTSASNNKLLTFMFFCFRSEADMSSWFPVSSRMRFAL
jgi:hypothetical protein